MADPAPTILLADDEEGIRSGLGTLLERSGFVVRLAADGDAALAAALEHPVDLCVLDVVMPGRDGRAVLRALRRAGVGVPVLLLTQVGEASERAMALDEGADDYLNKPFDPYELVARVRAVLRRTDRGRPSLGASGRLRADGLELDRVGRRAFLAGRELVLTPKAMGLLDYLVCHPGELLTRDRLLEVVWGWEHAGSTRAVDNRVAELRRALGDDPGGPRYIETVPGAGYRFRPEVRAA